jgi:hypothetical protein
MAAGQQQASYTVLSGSSTIGIVGPRDRLAPDCAAPWPPHQQELCPIGCCPQAGPCHTAGWVTSWFTMPGRCCCCFFFNQRLGLCFPIYRFLNVGSSTLPSSRLSLRALLGNNDAACGQTIFMVAAYQSWHHPCCRSSSS